MRHAEVLRVTWSAGTHAVRPFGRSGIMMRNQSSRSSTIGIVIGKPYQTPTVPIRCPPGASKAAISPFGEARSVETGTTGGGTVDDVVVGIEVVVVAGEASPASLWVTNETIPAVRTARSNAVMAATWRAGRRAGCPAEFVGSTPQGWHSFRRNLRRAVVVVAARYLAVRQEPLAVTTNRATEPPITGRRKANRAVLSGCRATWATIGNRAT